MNPGLWQGKRVFLTGHTGFKGSWMSLWLQSLGAELTGFALPPPTRPSLFEEARVASGMNSVMGDVRDLASVQEAMQASRPEIVIHMAAQSLVRYSYQNPVETYSTNVMGTVHVLESVRTTPGVKAVVNITSDKCYENREWLWGYRENERMGGFDPYSNSKGCSELLTSAYRSSFFGVSEYAQHGIGIATARAGNVIGGGDWAQDRLVPDVLAAFERGEIAEIRNPRAIRPWQYVLEPVRGYLTLAECLLEYGPDFAEAWNFGPSDDDSMPVEWIAETMARMWGNEARWKVITGEHPHEAAYLKLDISKARKRLAWRPVLRLDETLKLIVDWAKLRRAGDDVREITLDQIQTYQRMSVN